MKITFDYLEKNGFASVTDLCRKLVKDGSPFETIEVYRGDMLCLTVTDVEKASRLMPGSSGWKTYNRTRGTASPEALD